MINCLRNNWQLTTLSSENMSLHTIASRENCLPGIHTPAICNSGLFIIREYQEDNLGFIQIAYQNEAD